jgi:hypothetical protein
VASHGKVYSYQYYHPHGSRPYTTFSINPVSDTGASLTAFNRQRIVATARDLMVKKGLTPGDATADLLINIVSVDSSRAGQRAGRPLNEWYRLFHGDQAAPGRVGEQEIVGSLLSDSILGKMGHTDTVVQKRAARAQAGGVAAGRRPGADTSASRAHPGADTSHAPDSAAPPVPKPPAYAYGALIIDVIDRDKRVLLWEGVANRPVDVPSRDADKRVPAVVVRLLERFSPQGDSTKRDTGAMAGSPATPPTGSPDGHQTSK